jgi:alpha-beta hydrolase superfamily lysophospholipase
VVFPSGFPGRAQPAFDPEAQVFADLGFAVARLNHRCVAGMRPEDLNPLRAAVDRVSIDDAQAAIEAIAARNPNRPFDRKRVVTLGHGFGGYLALRALQLQPRVFRCGIAIDAPTELRGWLGPPQPAGFGAPARAPSPIPAALVEHAGADWKKLSVLDQADILTQPTLLLVEPGRNPAIDVSTTGLREKLAGLGRSCGYAELIPGFATAQPAARATAYRKIEEFLNQQLYGYEVKIGPAKEVQ